MKAVDAGGQTGAAEGRAHASRDLATRSTCLTNGFYRSAKHRVITPRIARADASAFFTYFSSRRSTSPLRALLAPNGSRRWP